MTTVGQILDYSPPKKQELFNTDLECASLDAIKFFMRPKGARTATYQKRFDEKIEAAHRHEPLVSRALLARFAVESIVHEKVPLTDEAGILQAKALLDEEIIVFKSVAKLRYTIGLHQEGRD